MEFFWAPWCHAGLITGLYWVPIITQPTDSQEQWLLPFMDQTDLSLIQY